MNSGIFSYPHNNINTINSFISFSEPLKIIYGIIGGIQSSIHVLSILLDIYYFTNEFKKYIILPIIKRLNQIIKIIFYTLKYILCLKCFSFFKFLVPHYFLKLLTKAGIINVIIIIIISLKIKENELIKKRSQMINENIYLDNID